MSSSWTLLFHSGRRKWQSKWPRKRIRHRDKRRHSRMIITRWIMQLYAVAFVVVWLGVLDAMWDIECESKCLVLCSFWYFHASVLLFLFSSYCLADLKLVMWGLFPPKARYVLDLTWRAAMPLLFHSLPGQGGFVPRAKFQGFASKTRDLNLKIHLYIYIHYQTWCRALPYFTHFKPFNTRSKAVSSSCVHFRAVATFVWLHIVVFRPVLDLVPLPLGICR